MCILWNKMEIMMELRTVYNVYLIPQKTLLVAIVIFGKTVEQTKIVYQF